MNNFDLKSAKYVSAIIVICIIFALAIWNAFKYLPDENAQGVNRQEVNLPQEEQQDDNQNVELKKDESESTDMEDENEYEDDERARVLEKVRRDIDFSNREENDEVLRRMEESRRREAVPELENISANDNENVSTEPETYESVFKNAVDLKKDKQYTKAISMYDKASNLASSSDEKAACYEEIASVYAIAKRYGSALAYAQKSYNLVPTTSREVLLARLYYKTGSSEKAETRMNNILKRDFSAE